MCLQQVYRQFKIGRKGWNTRWVLFTGLCSTGKIGWHKGKCEVLHLGKNNHIHQYMLGAHLLESSSPEKDLGVMVGTSSAMSQQYALAWKGQLHPGLCYSIANMSGEVILLLVAGLHGSSQALHCIIFSTWLGTTNCVSTSSPVDMHERNLLVSLVS